jgi:TolB-like protein/Flp pilus assembly protein TadD
LPLDLEPIELPREFAYQLAGIQRSSMTNIDSIIRALGKLGLEATGAPQAPTLTRQTDGRKSLMILPFEDLSPTGDNGWFADGLASELISALTNVKALRVADPQATKEFKRYQGTLPKYAHEMSIQYFVQGDVRKFGDQIKITTRLLDIETGDFLWQDSMKGTMQDIFDIQEKVAERVVEGLKVHLDSAEKHKLGERGTENVEAYELVLKAKEYYLKSTKQGYLLAIKLLTDAILLDPGYAQAYQVKASALTTLYRTYERDPRLLDEAEDLCRYVLQEKPEFSAVLAALAHVYLYRGQFDKAEEVALLCTQKNQDSPHAYATLASIYSGMGQPARAIAQYERAVRLQPDRLEYIYNLAIVCHAAKEEELAHKWSNAALPLFKRHVRLHPDDETKQVSYAALLQLSGRSDEARDAAKKLMDLEDGASLYNIACLLLLLEERQEALRAFRKSLRSGFSNLRLMKQFLIDQQEGNPSLQGTPEYEEVKMMVEQFETQSATRPAPDNESFNA